MVRLNHVQEEYMKFLNVLEEYRVLLSEMRGSSIASVQMYFEQAIEPLNSLLKNFPKITSFQSLGTNKQCELCNKLDDSREVILVTFVNKKPTRVCIECLARVVNSFGMKLHTCMIALYNRVQQVILGDGYFEPLEKYQLQYIICRLSELLVNGSGCTPNMEDMLQYVGDFVDRECMVCGQNGLLPNRVIKIRDRERALCMKCTNARLANVPKVYSSAPESETGKNYNSWASKVINNDLFGGSHERTRKLT